MPFFKKTAHNRCSVALCAVLVPILTFSLGANLVTLSAQGPVSSGLTSSEGINLLHGPFFHNRRPCLRLLPNAAGQQHRRQNQSQYSPHGISLLFFFFLIIIIGKTGKCNKEMFSPGCRGAGTPVPQKYEKKGGFTEWVTPGIINNAQV